jgi:hypothetical protein
MRAGDFQGKTMAVEADELIGSWELQRIELLGPGAEDQPPPFGGDPSGILHYMPDGRMVAILQNRVRPPIPGGRRGGTDADWRRAARSFTAYAARWTLEPDRVIHHVDFNSFPNDVGLDYIRFARFEGASLVLETPLDGPPDSRPMRLYWKRLGAGE